VRTLYFDGEKSSLMAIDQTKLPSELKYIEIFTPRQLFEAISTLAVRGAPAIGVAAALGLYAIALRLEDKDTRGFRYSFKKIASFISSSRPTAVNLFTSCGRMIASLEYGESIEEIKASLKKTAFDIEREDVEMCHAIGRHGQALIKDGARVLTHCNAGSLAAVEYGTALAPVYEAVKNGRTVHVYAGETRPLLQGARLTCFELTRAKIKTTLICDSAASFLMQSGGVDLVIVGCDRMAKNGDFANKIGTLSLAVNAAYYEVDFYVALPSSTFDENLPDGKGIIIEERKPEEVTDMFFSSPISPAGVGVYNPAFDITPHTLVTGYITEKGIFKKPPI